MIRFSNFMQEPEYMARSALLMASSVKRDRNDHNLERLKSIYEAKKKLFKTFTEVLQPYLVEPASRALWEVRMLKTEEKLHALEEQISNYNTPAFDWDATANAIGWLHMFDLAGQDIVDMTTGSDKK